MKKQLIIGLTLTAIATGSVMTGIQPAVADPKVSKYEWVTGHHGNVPPGAMQVGFADEIFYICSAGDSVGTLIPGHKNCYVPKGGKEIAYDSYKVLVVDRLVVDKFQWVTLRGNLPPDAIIGGHMLNGENLYICKGFLSGELRIGKFLVSRGVCYLPWGGKQHHIIKDFNLLISGDENH